MQRLLFSYLFAFFLIFSGMLYSADKNYTISGFVLDRQSKEGLAGANIALANTTVGATTGANGFFKLPPLPQGHYLLTVSYMGYSSRTIRIAHLKGDTTVSVGLDQNILSGPRISIVATRARNRVTPITFSNLKRQEISARHTIQDIPEVLSELPSTTFYSESGTGLGYSYLSIRGFGQRRISVMINGVPQNDPEDHNVYWVDFPDFLSNVQNIQVQRGAGSAFYGPAAIGGSINILSNYFLPQRQLRASAGYGSFNTKKYSLAYNSGLLFKKFVFYSRFSRIQTDGYRQHAWIDFKSYFLGLAYYTAHSSLRLQFYGGPIADALTYTGIPKEYNSNSKLRKKNFNWWGYADDGKTIYTSERRNDEIENFNQPHWELLHEYRINKRTTLNNTLFYIKGYGFFDYDGSWGTPEYFRLTPEYGFKVDSIPSDALIRAYVDNNQVGWLPQFIYKSPLGEFVFGAELRMHRSLHWGRLQKGTGLPATVVGTGGRHYYQYRGAKDIASVYLHQTSQIWPKVTLMSDLQYAYKKYRLYDEKFIGTDFSIPYHFLNPRLGINYNVTSRMDAYVNLSFTQREPRLKNFYDAAEASSPTSWGYVVPQFELNPDSSYNFNKPLVKPEALTDFELGYAFNTSRFQFTLNYYYMNFKDEIVKSGQLDRFGEPITGNADRTLHQGIELSGRFQISPKWQWTANATYGKNRLITYTAYRSSKATDLSGNPIAGFPDVLANSRWTYAWGKWYASLNWHYQGAFYTDNFKNPKYKVDKFQLFNFDFRYQLGTFENTKINVKLHISNLLNKKYLSHGEGKDFFPGAPRSYFVNLEVAY